MTRLLDSAMGTELARRGFELRAPLWGARALRDAPALIESIHRDTLAAGAEALVTSSFGLCASDASLAATAVELCRRIAPAGGCIGALGPADPSTSLDAQRAHHRELGTVLRDAGADVLFAETQTSLEAAQTAAQTLRPLGLPVWIALACGPEGKTLAGDDLHGVHIPADVVFVGCTEHTAMMPALRALAPRHDALGLRPSLGRTTARGFDPEGATEAEVVTSIRACAEHVSLDWVGGCCGTRPTFIGLLREAFPA